MFDIIIYATAALVIVCGGLYLITVRDEKRGAAKSAPKTIPVIYYTLTPKDKALLDAAGELLNARIKLRLTQHDVARLMKTSVSSVVKHQHGQIPTFDWLWSYADALGVMLTIKIEEEK